MNLATAKLPLFADHARTGHVLWLNHRPWRTDRPVCGLSLLSCALTSPTRTINQCAWFLTEHTTHFYRERSKRAHHDRMLDIELGKIYISAAASFCISSILSWCALLDLSHKAYYYSLIMTCNKSWKSPKPEIQLPLRLHSLPSGNSIAKLIPFLL